MNYHPRNSIKIGRFQLVIETNNIIEEKVESIVNAANDRLEDGGGICSVIFKGCGKQSLELACRYKLDKLQLNQLSVGQVVRTHACNLRKSGIKYIFHAVGPTWDKSLRQFKGNEDYEHQQCMSLAKCIENILLQAFVIKQLNSVSIPAISTGIYNFPVDLCAEVMIKTIFRYDQSNIPGIDIKLIRIVDVDQKKIAEFIKSLEWISKNS